jgi:phosphate transport system substrate-binding protein
MVFSEFGADLTRMHKKYFAFGLILALFACKKPQNTTDTAESTKKTAVATNKTTATSGILTILVEESVAPAILPMEEIYENLNPDTDVVLKVLKESEAIKALIMARDSNPVLFFGRMLKDDELGPLTNRQITPRYVRIARDAVAVIVHPSHKNIQLTFEQIKSILSGKTNKWDQLPKSGSGEINLVYDRQGSGVVQYTLDLVQSASLPKNSYAVEGTQAAIDYVAAHPNAMGLIGWSYVSDSDDQEAKANLKKVSMAAISPRDTLQGKTFFQPYQYDVGREFYPLTRDIYAVNIEGYAGLGTGFVNFAASERGQRMLQREGLVPAVPPARDVSIRLVPAVTDERQ